PRSFNLTPVWARNTFMPPCRSTNTAAPSAGGASASNRGSRSTDASGPPVLTASRARWSRCTRRSSPRRSGKASSPPCVRAPAGRPARRPRCGDAAGESARPGAADARGGRGGEAVQETRQAVSRTEGELAVERQRLADAERRGRLAGEIQDHE